MAATSSPVIIQTGGLTGNILNIISTLGGGTLLDSIPGTNIYLVNLPNLPVVTPLLQSLLGIVFMEPDKHVSSPARGQMGILTVPVQTGPDWYRLQPELERIEAPNAQTISKGRGVVVADLNSLVDYTHPALIGHLTGGYDFVSARSGYQGVLNSASASFLDQSSATFLDQSAPVFWTSPRRHSWINRLRRSLTSRQRHFSTAIPPTVMRLYAPESLLQLRQAA